MQANAILPQADILEKSNLIFFFFFMAGKKSRLDKRDGGMQFWGENKECK